MRIPPIDFASYDENDPASLRTLGESVGNALSEIGFMSVTNLGIGDDMLDRKSVV